MGHDEEYEARGNEQNHAEGDDGVGHGGLDAPLQLFGGFEVIGELHEYAVQVTARFTGAHHADVEVGIGAWMAAQGFGKGFAGFDVLSDVSDDLREIGVFGLFGEDVQALKQRQTGIDDGRQLAGEEQQFDGFNAAPSEPATGLGALNLNFVGGKAATLEHLSQCLTIFGSQHAALLFSVTPPGHVGKSRHIRLPPSAKCSIHPVLPRRGMSESTGRTLNTVSRTPPWSDSRVVRLP